MTLPSMILRLGLTAGALALLAPTGFT